MNNKILWIVGIVIIMIIVNVGKKEIVYTIWGNWYDEKGAVIIFEPLGGEFTGQCVWHTPTQSYLNCEEGCQWELSDWPNYNPDLDVMKCERCPSKDKLPEEAWSLIGYQTAYEGEAMTVFNNHCTEGCNTGADESPYGNCDGTVQDTELLSYAQAWINNQVTDTQLLQAAQAWLGG